MPDDRWTEYAQTKAQEALGRWIAQEIMQQTRTDGYIRDAFYNEFARVVYYTSIAHTYRVGAAMAWLERQIPEFTDNPAVTALIWSVIDLHSPTDEYRGDQLCASCGSSYSSEDPTDWPCDTFAAIVRSVGDTSVPEWLEPVGDDMSDSAARGVLWTPKEVLDA